jgi:LmbE family N-acetylglucosaminyl deacetylase
MSIFGAKADNEVLINMALQGMAPLLAQRLKESPKVKALIIKIAEAEQEAIAAHQSVIAKYTELREQLGDLLSENGLQFVLEDFAAAQAPAPSPDPAPVPAPAPAPATEG